jgi:uncharacterized protein YjbI with pentapeptide repeats
MPAQEDAQKSNAAASLAPSAIVLLLFYIVITVAGHADSDLVRPDTQVSLEAASQKVSLPSGWIFTPFLGLKLSIPWFYAFAPILVLALHFELLTPRSSARQPWGLALRWAGNILAPLALFLLLWKFAPYGRSRPPDISDIQGAMLLSYAHAGALIVDAALLMYAHLEPSALYDATIANRSTALRRIGLAVLAVRASGLLAVSALAFMTFVKVAAERAGIPEGFFQKYLGVSDTTLVGGTVILLALVMAPVLVFAHRLHRRPSGLPRFGRTATAREVILMPVYLCLLVVLFVSVALPDLGRALDLAGAKLVATEPADAITAAMITSTRGPESARMKAWEYFGRGLDYRGWRFVGASFDGAIMPKVRLDRADLSDASFIRADLTNASLVGAKLARTMLVEADLRAADLSCINTRSCSLLAQQAAPPAQTQTRTTPVAKACSGSFDGPKLNNAILTGATLAEANLNNASLQNATIVNLKAASKADLSGADLTGR